MNTAFPANPTLAQLLDATTLQALAYRYCKHCWSIGWRIGKEAAQRDPQDPFLGGPMDLVAQGITELTRSDGTTVTLGPLVRLRMRDLSDESLRRLNIYHLKAKVDGGKDVVHPEFVPTFEENVANSDAHLKNNLVAAAAVINFVCNGQFIPLQASISEAIDILTLVLDGTDATRVRELESIQRASWITRAVCDGSWKTSADFTFDCNLGEHARSLDTYVVRPVLQYMLQDLHCGSLVDEF